MRGEEYQLVTAPPVFLSCFGLKKANRSQRSGAGAMDQVVVGEKMWRLMWRLRVAASQIFIARNVWVAPRGIFPKSSGRLERAQVEQASAARRKLSQLSS